MDIKYIFNKLLNSSTPFCVFDTPFQAGLGRQITGFIFTLFFILRFKNQLTGF